MAAIVYRGELQWQAKVRMKGYLPVCKTFTTKAQAEKWARMIESEMDQGVFVSRAESESTTLEEAFERYLAEITPSKKGLGKRPIGSGPGKAIRSQKGIWHSSVARILQAIGMSA